MARSHDQVFTFCVSSIACIVALTLQNKLNGMSLAVGICVNVQYQEDIATVKSILNGIYYQ